MKKMFSLSLLMISTLTAKQPHYWKPELYVQGSDLQLTTALNVIADITWGRDDTVLDIGCGDGRISKLIANTYVSEGLVLGIDVSEEMITYACAHHGSTPSLKFKCIDANNIDFKNKFNTIVAFTSLQHVQDKLNIFKRIYNSLKKDGSFVTTLPDLSKSKLVRVFKEITSSNHWAPHFNRPSGIFFTTKKELETFLIQSGFKNFEVIEHQDLYQFSEQQDFYNFLAAHPHINHLSVEQKNVFLKEFINIYRQMYAGEQKNNTGITYSETRFLIKASK